MFGSCFQGPYIGPFDCSHCEISESWATSYGVYNATIRRLSHVSVLSGTHWCSLYRITLTDAPASVVCSWLFLIWAKQRISCVASLALLSPTRIICDYVIRSASHHSWHKFLAPYLFDVLFEFHPIKSWWYTLSHTYLFIKKSQAHFVITHPPYGPAAAWFQLCIPSSAFISHVIYDTPPRQFLFFVCYYHVL